MTDYRINMYRANIFYQQKKYEEALEQINIALSKNNKVPFLYQIRYDIRKKLGQVENEKTDADLIKNEELKKEWKFEK